MAISVQTSADYLDCVLPSVVVDDEKKKRLNRGTNRTDADHKDADSSSFDSSADCNQYHH